jgi:signal transduction histidine kinase
MHYQHQKLKVIIVENSLKEVSTLSSEIAKINESFHQKHISSLEELKNQLSINSWSLVISEYNLLDFSAFDALSIVKEYSPDTPFILLTDGLSEEIVADLMKAGVEDVVHKTRLERLSPAIKRILRSNAIRLKEEHAQKMASQAFAAKEQMLAIVSHDIKNPISAIQLEAQMLLRASDKHDISKLSEEVKIQANRILKTTERMKILISDLLDKNKSENGLSHLLKENMNISKIIQEVIDSIYPLMQEKKISLKTLIPEILQIDIDRNKMFQVFSNLLHNAIKFTPIGGSIEISIEETSTDLFFTVEDSGPGLSELECQKVFDKYWTGSKSNTSGTGLGLFICKTIIESHGGHIQVNNILGQGARFRFNLPRFVQIQMKSPRLLENLNSFGRKNIFIIDDDEDLREVMSWALSKEGHFIYAFQSPQEALDCIQGSEVFPNLIIVDYHMGEMNGKDFVIKKDLLDPTKCCPVLMITASPTEVERDVPRELYSQVITKPIDLEGLVDNVRKLIEDTFFEIEI